MVLSVQPQKHVQTASKRTYSSCITTKCSWFSNQTSSRAVSTHNRYAALGLCNARRVVRLSKKINIDRDLIKKDIVNKKKQKEFLLSEIMFETKTKEELNEFMNMLFIENVWCFHSVHSDLDLFRHSRVTTLDNFF